MSEDKKDSNHVYQDDSLPDSSQLASFKLTENMQHPLMYDTKEYHPPISQTAHGPSFLIGSLVAGFIFSVIVLVVLVLSFNIFA